MSRSLSRWSSLGGEEWSEYSRIFQAIYSILIYFQQVNAVTVVNIAFYIIYDEINSLFELLLVQLHRKPRICKEPFSTSFGSVKPFLLVSITSPLPSEFSMSCHLPSNRHRSLPIRLHRLGKQNPGGVVFFVFWKGMRVGRDVIPWNTIMQQHGIPWEHHGSPRLGPV